ncbi:MAG: MBL fold metallo-hydrolase [Planctomycetota bacterium]
MLFETVETPGLAQRSYLIGSQGQAAVIDPRRDCEVYLELARKRGLEIRYVLETHRNEDLISGAPTLAEWTGARVLHGPNPAGPVAYAETVREGERLELGQLILEVLETPGHTDDHLAFALFDQDYPDGAVGVFTGDALFVGDVGRADFYPERREQVAGQLYDSLQKLLALGDQALIYPAHGAGSVCGSGVAERGFSSIGLERRNPLLQLDREAFVARKLAETHYIPPYFQLMRRLNLEGAPPPPRVLRPRTRCAWASSRAGTPTTCSTCASRWPSSAGTSRAPSRSPWTCSRPTPAGSCARASRWRSWGTPRPSSTRPTRT